MSEVRSGMVIAGKYRLEAVLARGGMGSVWKARHLTLDTPLALKFISAEVFALPEARRRFEREAKAAALLQSPHVVQIHDYGVEGNLPYLVMELLSGEDLGARLKRTDRLDPHEAAVIVVQVARALRRAAEAGIVHRDLKPSNVFLVSTEEDEELIKVLDFGIAKAPRELRADDDSTKKGAIIGSPRYMSPEQARGSPLVDPRSDLWSLAVIAYRAVTGELPFQSNDMTDLIVKICSETPIPPSHLNPELGPEMDAFFVYALDRDPAKRFQTARELAVAFAVAAGAPPPSLGGARALGKHISGTHRLSDAVGLAPVSSPPPSSSQPLAKTLLSGQAPPAEPPSRRTPEPPSRRTPEPPSRRTPEPPEPPSPTCETTRISGRPQAAEPASDAAPAAETPSARNSAPLPKGTPTPYPSGVDVPALRSARPQPAMIARRPALAAGLGALLVGALIGRWWWPSHAPMPAVADSAAASPEAAPPPRAPPVEPWDPVVEPTAAANEPAMAPTAAPSAPKARRAAPPPPPTGWVGPRKRHVNPGI